jgi:hypothetical protein
VRTWLIILSLLLAATPAAADPEAARPVIVAAPSGHLVPARAVSVSASLDSAGRPSSDVRVGLGGVAEFGIGTADAIGRIDRRRAFGAASTEPIDEAWRYVTATFRMGVAEDRLFRGQPAVALGFRKSFERDRDDIRSRLADLHLVASRGLGPVTLHAGVDFWDASLQRGTEEPSTFHDQPVGEQVRPIGGVEVRPLPRSRVLADLSWRPELRPGAFRLAPVLSGAVRYDLSDAISVDAGVHLAADEVTVFGSVTFVTRLPIPRR